MSSKNTTEKILEIDAHVSKHYDIVRRLGKGAYGIVWKAIDKKNKETVAMKKIFDAFGNQTDAQRTFREIMFLLSFANHENIIRLIGLHKANNDRDIYLIFEYMETDLHNVIKKGNILKDVHKVYIMYQLFKAIKYIHSGNVIHRDLKPSNVLLNAQCHCKIADFGLARSVTQIGEGDGETASDPTLTDYVATRWYRAPEILVASRRYTKGIDMWSLGCILGEMLLGKPLFPGSSTINQVERIMATLPPPTKEDLISVCAGYGTNLLEKTPYGPRRSLKDLLPDVPKEALNLISNLIVFNPNHRLTAVEALEHLYVANFHRRSNEPERGSNVVPLLRDDVQLSVDEYRNKLYSMMDEKHRKHKNMSKSRVRRLSEHIRKETAISNSSPVIGQGDVTVGKNLAHSYQDLRKDRCRTDTYEPSCSEVRTQLPSRKTTRNTQIDSGERTTKTRSISTCIESQMSNTRNFRSTAKTVATQYTYNLMNGAPNNLAPNTTKSCLYINQQRPLSKSQRSIQSDQVTVCAPGGKSCQPAQAGRVKLRRNCKQNRGPNRAASNVNWREEDRQKSTILHDSPKSLQTKYFSRTLDNNCGYLRTCNSGSDKRTDNRNNDESRHSVTKNQVVQNYLNQTMPSRVKGQTSHLYRSKDINYRTISQCDASSIKKPQQTANFPNNRTKNAAPVSRCQKPVTDGNNEKKSKPFLDSYTQSHGVITASMYKELRNGTIRW
ncbi:mitogen-activated protein kinase 15 isoform X1 [Osmia lignaria lignaria]|uniref:mitogen-activated protein kinase 15-like isoform X1 n=2 Tax=Osmia lignaria TaxID=473952 RepID=UPI00147931D7|nr:mitogen-activated protein kinase 15-like isoform X1 [Osmia lignaria]XP_034174195.1 mitogen-activated protein kinase 15-like isoform X1 [Osmia lignaria]